MRINSYGVQLLEMPQTSWARADHAGADHAGAGAERRRRGPPPAVAPALSPGPSYVFHGKFTRVTAILNSAPRGVMRPGTASRAAYKSLIYTFTVARAGRGPTSPSARREGGGCGFRGFRGRL
jgi:hypothetical protein